MAEYIERDAVHDLVRSLTKYALASPGNTRHRITVDADDVDFGVDKIPSADVAPVRHGRWVKIYENGEPAIEQHQVGVFCTRCKKMPKYRFTKSDFCPNCGCKMDLEG